MTGDMSRVAFPADIVPEERPEDGFVATFPDVRGAIAGEATWGEALASASDALRAALAGHAARERLPRPSPPAKGQVMVPLDPASAAKVALRWALEDRGQRAADLARAMGIQHRQVSRLLNLDYPSQVDSLLPALKAMGLQFDTRIAPIPAAPRNAA